jgi:AcrR family transcriptional regulator
MVVDDAGVKKRVRLSGAARREKILDAAAELFAARGFHETSVGEIAAAAGISKVVLYDHFASKHALFVELTEAARDGLLARGRAQMQAEGPFEARMRAALEAFFGYVEDEPARARLLLLLPKGEPELRDVVAAIQDKATSGLVGMVGAEASLLRGEPDRTERLVLIMEFIKTGLHGLVEWWVRHPSLTRQQMVDAAMTVAWTGLRAQLRA